jgi:subtilisin family serine protease
MSFSRKMAAFAVLALVASSAAFASAEFKDGEVIVKYRPGVVRPRQAMNLLYDAAGVRAVRYLRGTMKGFEHVLLEESVKVQDAIAEFEKNPMVEYAQPNYIIRISPSELQAELPESLQNPPPGGIPCIPGFDIPGCDPNAKWPCLIPGIPFPPGCDDSGGGGGGNPGNPGNPGTRPELQPAPPEVIPPMDDPENDKAYGLKKIGAVDSWPSHRGDKQMVVAVIDTGIDYNHEDLSFNVWRNPSPTKNDVAGYDFIHNDGLPFDDQGHGTHCAGTIGAVGGNGKGLSGVNQRVSIMGLKFLSAEGSGTTDGAIQAIDYAVKNGAKVLSNSWGGPGGAENKALYDAIERARAAGVLFIAAAGNDGKDNDNPDDASYPAGFDNENLISVAATDQNDKMAFFSNYGRRTVHVAAPGVNVYSLAPGGGFATMSGTSMACPHVAGAAALLWSKNPTWDFKKVKETLLNTVDAVPALVPRTVTGGRVNLVKALQVTQ